MLAIRRPLIVQQRQARPYRQLVGSTLLPSAYQLPMQAMQPCSSNRLSGSGGSSSSSSGPAPCRALPSVPGAQRAKHGPRSGLPILWPGRVLLASSIALGTGKQPGLNHRWATHRGISVPAAMAAVAGGSGSGSGTDTGAIVVYVTVPNQEVGEQIGSSLVEAKLAACVNVVPGITSIYWWDGKVNKDAELLLIIKTRRTLLDELTTFVKAKHPYNECEVIALPIEGGSPSYLEWVMASTKEK